MKSKEGEEEENKLLNLRNKNERRIAQARNCERRRHGSPPPPPRFSHVRLAWLPRLTNVTLCAHERVAPLASTCVYVRSSGATEQIPEMYFHEGAEDPPGKQLILREEKPDGLCAEPSVKVWSSEERTPVALRLMSCP